MATKKATAIPKIKDVSKDAAPEVQDAEKSTALVKTVVIEEDDAMELAVRMAAEIKEKHDEVDAKRRSWVDPLRMVVDDINAFFNPALEALKKAESTIKIKVASYVESNLAKRDHILRTVNLTPVEKRATCLEKADKLIPRKVSGLSIREGWSGSVVDKGDLIKWAVEEGRYEFLNVDEKALKAVTKAAGRDPEIPGWQARPTRTVVVTPSKVKR